MRKLHLVKQTGDKLTAQEFNTVVESINDNDSRISKNTNDIASLAGKIHAEYYMTQEQYDALKEQGDIDPDADYNIFEE